MTRVTILIGMILGVQGLSANQVRIGHPSYGGTGCPAGTASAIVSPDQSAISILFDQFTVEAGRDVGRSMDRKACNLSIPVEVPNGFSVSIFQVDYRGYNQVPWGATNTFEAEYFWAGSRGPRLTRQFRGPVNDSFTLTDTLMANTLVWTPCGQSVTLRVNANIRAQSNRRGEQTLGVVDSADISSGLIYHIRYRRCY